MDINITHIKKKWKFSKLRFYLLNFKSNYSFWLTSRRKFNNITYLTEKPNGQRKRVQRRRFKGYVNSESLFLDNPGFLNIEDDVWLKWKSIGLF